MWNTWNKLKIIVLAVFACGLLTGGLTLAIYQWAHRITNVGIIRVIGVEIYRDETLTEILDKIDWGLVSPGENKTSPAWIKNTGNDAQKLVMWTESWNPTNSSDWITFAWDYHNSWIPMNASIPVLFTLSIDSNIEGIETFSFDIWIKGVH